MVGNGSDRPGGGSLPAVRLCLLCRAKLSMVWVMVVVELAVGVAPRQGEWLRAGRPRVMA